MSDFRISYEAWASRPHYEKQELMKDERSRLDALREAIKEALEPMWWGDYVKAGNRPSRGNHFGVYFGFDVEDGDDAELTRQMRQIVEAHGFTFDKGFLTVWAEGE